MNKILKEKINEYIIKIIGKYLLPTNKTNYLDSVLSETTRVYQFLNLSGCCDYFGRHYINSLKNSELRRIKINYNQYYWTIRSKKSVELIEN